MIREAILSGDGQYRYSLTRRWGDSPAGLATVTWIMLNPSTADGVHHAGRPPAARSPMTLPLYGAPDPTDRTRTPPNGAKYVSPAGDDQHGDGTTSQPWATLQHAHDHGGTHIIMRAGRYHQSVSQRWERPLAIWNAPGEHAELVGSTRRTDWTHDPVTGLWSLPFEPLDATPNATGLNDQCAWATRPEQVWYDDIPLTMCDPAGRPGPGEFRVDTDLHRLEVADDPTDRDVEVGDLTRAVAGQAGGSHPFMDLRGFDVRRYVTTSRERAAVTVFADGGVVEHLTIDGCSAAGLSMRGSHQHVALTTLTRCGQLGGHGYLAHELTLFGLLIGNNNRKLISRITEAGGWKLANSEGVTVQQCLLRGNLGHGMWLDLLCHDATIIRNIVESGMSSGLFFEYSDGAIIAGNYVEGCPIGILASASNAVELLHNTIRGCPTPWLIRSGHPGHDPRRGETSGHLVAGNDGGTVQYNQPPVQPTEREVWLLDLIRSGDVDARHAGWYGPIPITTPPPPEDPPPMPYDETPLRAAMNAMESYAQVVWTGVDQAIAHIRTLEDEVATLTLDRDTAAVLLEAAEAEVVRLQAIIDGDEHLATIADLTEQLRLLSIDLWNTAVLANTLTATIGSLNAQIAQLTEQRNAALLERDNLQVTVDAQEDLLEQANDELALRAARILELEQLLEDCEGDPFEPLPDSLLPDTSIRRYRTLIGFNSNVGEDSPDAVAEDLTATPPQPDVKEGWYWDTTAEAKAKMRAVLQAAKQLAGWA